MGRGPRRRGNEKGGDDPPQRVWCKKAKSEQPGGLNAVKVDRRLAEIAKIDRETPAAVLAARPSVPINKWFPLLTSPSVLTGWETADCHFSYDKGIIELRDGEMFCPIVAKDVTIRAKVKCPITSTGQVRLLIRNSSQGYYAARISGGTLSIVKQKHNVSAAGRSTAGQSAPSQSAAARSADVDEDVLNKITLPHNKRGVRVLDFEFGFSAVGDTLTAVVNGRPALQAKDAAFSEGTVGIGTGRSNNVYFTDLVILIPNKASFVADQRSPAASKPAAKSP